MSDAVAKIEELLSESGDVPAAMVLREYLNPVEGKDGVLFPPTFAAAQSLKDFPGGYNIDTLGDGKNVCLIDSVGSQANRIEPMFSTAPYDELVPRIVVEAGSRKINLLEAGHRAGDAIVRCSALKDDLQKAFKALKAGDAMPLAKLAPTSLVFGVWDSRDTQAKAPRLLAATVRAFDVGKLTRSAQYNPATDYVEEGLLDDTADKDALERYSERGFRHVPASATHGGVIARGEIRREVTLHLAALRLLRAADASETAKLRAYLLGLALTAFTRPALGFLRQGCNLVLDADRVPESKVVYASGRREKSGITHEAALEFAKKAATAFGVEKGREVNFDKALAKEETAGDDKKKGKKGKDKPAKAQ
ncbi:MAG: type I-U CRISPR-associated protein Cas7 [Myxococcales bacterium]|nr:type I-U CRISPR-associated protein Cas7 [Myxococcales bacterium]